jgi:hypothetical protein
VTVDHVRDHGLANQHARRQVVESANSALKGAFANLNRGFFRVMGLVKTTVLSASRLLRTTSTVFDPSKPSMGWTTTGKRSKDPSGAGPAGAPGREPNSSNPAPLPPDLARPPSRHQPTSPAVGFSAFWIDEGAESGARRTLRGAVGRAHSPKRRPNGAAAQDFHEHSGLPFGNTPQTEGCSYKPLSRKNASTGMEAPQVKSGSLHNGGQALGWEDDCTSGSSLHGLDEPWAMVTKSGYERPSSLGDSHGEHGNACDLLPVQVLPDESQRGDGANHIQ